MKLHELLAAEGTAKGQADKARTDLAATFDKKRHLFAEKLVTFQSNAEGVPAVTEEQSSLQSTVHTELHWIAQMWSKALDLAYSIDVGNQTAKADVLLDNGQALLKDVPATALLQLEKRANEIRAFIGTIPTLDPAKGFKPDPDKGAGVFVANVERKNRPKKVESFIVVVQPTEQHPAQVQKVVEDQVIGTIQTQEWSGMITPAEKSNMLNRADEVLRAFKTARSRANDIKVEKHEIGSTVFSYVFLG